jgi:hypothetical protein
VVRAEGSRPRGRGFESRRILDGCKRCLAITLCNKNNENKGSQMGYTKKIFKKENGNKMGQTKNSDDTFFGPHPHQNSSKY